MLVCFLIDDHHVRINLERSYIEQIIMIKQERGWQIM